MKINRKNGYLISGLLILILTLTALFLIFLFIHPDVYFSKASGFSQHDGVKAGKNKLRFVVPETVDVTKSTFISVKQNWFTTSRMGKITEIKAKPKKYLALDFTDREYDSEVFTIYTKNWFGIKREHDVIVDYSNFLRVFFLESHDGAVPRKPIILPYSKLQTEYKHIYEELYKMKGFMAFDKDGIASGQPVSKEDVFTKENAKGRAFIVNNNTYISLVYDFVLPGIFKNQTQKTQVYDLVEKTIGKTKTFDPEKQGLEIKFNTPPFYISKFLGWYYIDPVGNRVDLNSGQEFQIPKWVKSELRLIAKYDITTDTNKIGPELDKQGLVAISYFDGVERVFFDIVKKGSPLKEHFYQKDGYAYAGWYKDSALTEKVDFTKELANTNTVLYLKSIKQNQPKPEKPIKYHTVSFITPNDANQLLPTKRAHGQKLETNYLTPSIVTALDANGDLLELDYWNLVDPVTGVRTRYDFNTPITEDITLEAVMRKRVLPTTKYIIKKYFESVDQTGNFVEDKTKEEIVEGQTPGQEVELSPTQTNAPYGFTLDSSSVLKKKIKKDGTTVFELKYKRNRYKVDFEVNYNGNHFKGVATSSEPSQTVVYEGKLTRPTNPAITKAGYTYTFKHWQLKDEMGNVYKEVSEFDFNTKITKNTTLVAYFEEKVDNVNYTIKHIYKGFGSTQDIVETEVKEAQVGSQVTVTEADARVKEGFEVQLVNETKTINANGQTTFTLTYERKTYLVEYDYNGGTLNGETKTTQTYKFEENLRDIEHPKKTDPSQIKTYTFAGWQNKETGEIVDFSQNFKVTKNLNLKATWTEAIATRPVYLKMIWEKISEQTDTVVERQLAKQREIGDTAKFSDQDVKDILNQYLANNPRPYHQTNFDTANSKTEVRITTSLDKHYITVYFKAKTYTVEFDRTGLVPASVAPELRQTLTLKHSQTVPSDLIAKMKLVQKQQTATSDFVFDRLVETTTSQDFNENLAYNQNIKIKPEFTEKDAEATITPKLSAADADKADASAWRPQNGKVGTKFDFNPQQSVKKGWKFIGWTKVEGNPAENIYFERGTKEVWAVFEPAETQYTIRHVFKGIEKDNIPDEIKTTVNTAKTNSVVQLNNSHEYNSYNKNGFVAQLPPQSEIIRADGSTVFEIIYQRREFDIDFIVNYKNQFNGTVSSVPQTQKVKYEGKVEQPQVPTISRHGRTYEFIHWQTEVSMNGTYSEQNAYDFLSKVTNNFTLVAYFKETIETVRYKVVHKLEKQGKYSSLDGKYDEVPEIISNQKVEDGATYRDYYALDSNLYEKDTTHPDNVLYAQLTAGDNTTEVRQYYKLKEISVEFKKTEGIKNFKTADTIKVKKTRRITLPEYELKDNYKFIGWSLSETGAVESEFIAGDSNMQIFAQTDIEDRKITYTIRTQRVDGEFDEKTETVYEKIGKTHYVSYKNPDQTTYKDPIFSRRSLVVNIDEEQNKVVVQFNRIKHTVDYMVIGHSSHIPDKTFLHGAEHGEIDDSKFKAEELLIVKIELDHVLKTKEEIKSLKVIKNHRIKLYIDELTRNFGKYPQTEIRNPNDIQPVKEDERELKFKPKDKEFTFKFKRYYFKDSENNMYEKYNGKYYKIEDVVFVKIPKRDTWITRRILDFTPFNIDYYGYPGNNHVKNSIFKSMVEEIGKILNVETFMPTYDDGEFSVKAMYDAGLYKKLIKEATDYARAVNRQYIEEVSMYRGVDLSNFGDNKTHYPWYREVFEKNWWVASENKEYSSGLARAIISSYSNYASMYFVYGVVVCIR